MKTDSKKSVAVLALFSGIAVALASGTAFAFEPQLEKAIQQGKTLYTENTFGGSGRVCQSCHLGGGKEPGQLPNGKAIPSLANAAAIFPRFRAKDGKVITLSDQIRSCVAGALQGTPPEYGSDDLNALVTYVTSLSQGKPIDMGGKPQ